MVSENDKRLVQQLKKGDVSSFDELFKRFNQKIYFFSLRYLKNKEEAEGIVQEVFLSLWKNRARLKVEADFQAYLFSISFNAIKKRFRKLSREKKHLEAYLATVETEASTSDPTLHYKQLNELLEKSTAKLPPRQREIFLLSKKEGLTAEEIATKLALSKRTVENHLFRAKAFLKSIIVDERLLSSLFFWMFVR